MKIFIFALLTTVSCVDQEFLQANKWFSASVYKKFSKNIDGNFLLSPFSVEAILALTQAGCKGQTAEEVRSVLNSTSPQQITRIFKNLVPSLGDQKYTLQAANKIYVKDDFSLRPDFINIAEGCGADTETVDFNRREEAVRTMNRWVEKQTKDKIRGLIESSSLNDRTRAVLINALYFKANWSRPFLVAYTRNLTFHLTPKEEVLVDMMLLHDKPYNYYESATLKARFLEVPFKGEDASMVIALPDAIDGLPFLEKQIKKVLKSHTFVKHSINLGFPRFKIETSVDFKKILKSMGVKSIFDDQYADLSGIAGEKGDLVVDKVAQKSFIDVSEEGVEAASATYTLIAIPMSGPAQVPKNFRIDRPFIFYIKVKEVIIFVGRVVDPRN